MSLSYELAALLPDITEDQAAAILGSGAPATIGERAYSLAKAGVITEAQASVLCHAFNLVTDALVEEYSEGVIDGLPAAARQFRPIWNLTYEELWVVCIDNAGRVCGKQRISTGATTSTVGCTQAVARIALTDGAMGVFVAHNHPSGQLLPSGPDRQMTGELKMAMDVLGLRLLGSLIVSGANWYDIVSGQKGSAWS